ncbi:MAG: hypothetical protein LKF61_03170 [Eggerthellaceae bacterium]|jgi:hypothetical protein|nr:hypothetical protein [Eggerthellaceae bacterium]MCH4221362.1 hypothetical protein [Eggerthellaceae bacterium]
MSNPRSNDVQLYSLMSKNNKICDFVYDACKEVVTHIEHIDNEIVAPLGVYSRPGQINAYALTRWISKRCMPAFRSSMSSYKVAGHALSPIDLMFKSLGLNLSDQYWFCPCGYDFDWNAINCFDNSYPSTMKSSKSQATTSGFVPQPDASTQGELDKHWFRDSDGINCLRKAGSGRANREPFSEILASKMLARLLPDDEYVTYTADSYQGAVWSRCPTCITTETELVPAEDVYTYFGHSEKDFFHQYHDDCIALGVENISAALDKMIVCDFLMSNPDRHTYNFGLIRDSNTGACRAAAPLFDNGAAFGARQSQYDIEHGFPYISHPFSENPLVQLDYVQDYSWLDLNALDGFEVEIQQILSSNPSMNEAMITCLSKNFVHNVSVVSDAQKQHLCS